MSHVIENGLCECDLNHIESIKVCTSSREIRKEKQQHKMVIIVYEHERRPYI